MILLNTHHRSVDLATWQELLGREGGQGGPPKGRCSTTKLCTKIWTLTLTMNKLIPPMMESPPLPLPTLYCISQASPIMGFTLRPVTRGGGPVPLLTMAPWGPKRLRCCTVSMPPPPATPPSSTYTARINLRTQVCICASISPTFWTFQFDSLHYFMGII